MDQIEVKQVSAPQASKCIFVITDAEGHMTARLTSRSAVNDTCELIEQWAGHRKLQRYLYHFGQLSHYSKNVISLVIKFVR